MEQNKFKTLPNNTIKHLLTKIKSAIDNSKLDFIIDDAQSRVGLKYSKDTDYNYTKSLVGKTGSSITDVYIDENTEDMVIIVSDDPLTDAVPTYSTPITINTLDNSSTQITIKPNIMYTIGQISQLSVTLDTPEDISVYNEYMLQFETSGSGATVVFDSSIAWVVEPNIQPNMIYQISILNNVGVIAGTPIQSAI